MEPGHQEPCYWSSSSRMFSHQKSLLGFCGTLSCYFGIFIKDISETSIAHLHSVLLYNICQMFINCYRKGIIQGDDLPLVFESAVCRWCTCEAPWLPLMCDNIDWQLYTSGSSQRLRHRNHSGYGLGQWEEALHSNASSHCPSPYPEWSLLRWPAFLSWGSTGLLIELTCSQAPVTGHSRTRPESGNREWPCGKPLYTENGELSSLVAS